MRPEARIQTASEILDAVLDGAPAEKALTRWARTNRYAGSKDRAALRDLVFEALRRKRSYAALGGNATGRGLMLGLARAQGLETSAIFTGERHAPAQLSEAEQSAGRDPNASEARDIPDWLWPYFEASLGDLADAETKLLRDRAAVYLRVNALKSSMSQAMATLSDQGIVCEPHPLSPNALQVLEGARRIHLSDAYRDGLVELQDVASQAVVDFLPLEEGASCLDYCAGGGGKALAVAAKTRATVVAYDIDTDRMKDIPERARRANADVQVASQISGQFDLVLCDAPCSGSGSWRRAPEAKWRLTQDRLEALTEIQAGILDTATKYVGPSGHLAYATCSLFADENRNQIDAFLARNSGWSCVADRQFLLSEGGDGFYISLMKRD